MIMADVGEYRAQVWAPVAKDDPDSPNDSYVVTLITDNLQSTTDPAVLGAFLRTVADRYDPHPVTADPPAAGSGMPLYSTATGTTRHLPHCSISIGGAPTCTCLQPEPAGPRPDVLGEWLDGKISMAGMGLTSGRLRTAVQGLRADRDRWRALAENWRETAEAPTWAHDAHCNTTHTPGPEPCPPARCNVMSTSGWRCPLPADHERQGIAMHAVDFTEDPDPVMYRQANGRDYVGEGASPTDPEERAELAERLVLLEELVRQAQGDRDAMRDTLRGTEARAERLVGWLDDIVAALDTAGYGTVSRSRAPDMVRAALRRLAQDAPASPPSATQTAEQAHPEGEGTPEPENGAQRAERLTEEGAVPAGDYNDVVIRRDRLRRQLDTARGQLAELRCRVRHLDEVIAEARRQRAEALQTVASQREALKLEREKVTEAGSALHRAQLVIDSIKEILNAGDIPSASVDVVEAVRWLVNAYNGNDQTGADHVGTNPT